MGHVRLGQLPKSKKWQQVVALVETGAGVEEIAAAASEAAERALRRCAREPALSYAFWLLTQLPLAAREKNFAGRLRELGLTTSRHPSLVELAGAFSAAVQAHARKESSRTDFGEMAKLSAVESLTAVVGRSLSQLFGTTPAEVQSA